MKCEVCEKEEATCEINDTMMCENCFEELEADEIKTVG